MFLVQSAMTLSDVFTIATLPDAPSNYRRYAFVSDLFGGPGDYCISDGVNWKPVRPFSLRSVAAANLTLQALTSAPTQIVTGTIATGITLTLTLSTALAYPGAMFRVTRKATGLGTLTASVGVALPSSAWQDYEYDGTAWQSTATGGLL